MSMYVPNPGSSEAAAAGAGWCWGTDAALTGGMSIPHRKLQISGLYRRKDPAGAGARMR